MSDKTSELTNRTIGFIGLGFMGKPMARNLHAAGATMIIHSRSAGPVEELVLENNKLVVDGKFAFARSSTLNYSCQKATKSLLGSATSGEGMVRVYEGTGKVLMSPIAFFPSHFLGAGSVTAE